MDATSRLKAHLGTSQAIVGKVVDFDDTTDRLYHLDLTADNAELNEAIFGDAEQFNKWINNKLLGSNSRYATGGYMEHRTIYARSPLFDTAIEPRRLHLGVDIWGPVGTSVYSPLPGKVHSFNDNDNYGDYGPTLILEHDLNGFIVYSLYGHLSRRNLTRLARGRTIDRGQQVGHFGDMDENGQWPPHLHFQLMLDMEGNAGRLCGRLPVFREREIQPQHS